MAEIKLKETPCFPRQLLLEDFNSIVSESVEVNMSVLARGTGLRLGLRDKVVLIIPTLMPSIPTGESRVLAAEGNAKSSESLPNLTPPRKDPKELTPVGNAKDSSTGIWHYVKSLDHDFRPPEPEPKPAELLKKVVTPPQDPSVGIQFELQTWDPRPNPPILELTEVKDLTSVRNFLIEKTEEDLLLHLTRPH